MFTQAEVNHNLEITLLDDSSCEHFVSFKHFFSFEIRFLVLTENYLKNVLYFSVIFLVQFLLLIDLT